MGGSVQSIESFQPCFSNKKHIIGPGEQYRLKIRFSLLVESEWKRGAIDHLELKEPHFGLGRFQIANWKRKVTDFFAIM